MRVLVIQTRRIGDVLMITPLLRALRRAHPEAVIDVLVEPACACALAGNPNVDQRLSGASAGVVTAGRLRQARYDVVIDAMAKNRAALLTRASGAAVRIGFAHARLAWCYTDRVGAAGEPLYSALEKLRLLGPLGVEALDCALDVPGDEDDRARGDAWWASLGLEDAPAPIAVAPVSRRAYKRWPPDRFARTYDLLAERSGRRLLPLFGPGEALQLEAVLHRSRRRDAFVYPVAELPFASLGAALSRCAGYVGCDNGIRHVAIGVGLPTLAVFGRPAPVNWTPPDAPQHLAIGGHRDPAAITFEEILPQLEALERLIGAPRSGPAAPPRPPGTRASPRNAG